MTLATFQALVEQNPQWFQGVHPETPASVAEAERRLGVMLPPSLAWLLINHGYSAACGIDALDEAITMTLRAREVLGLPNRYILLNDWQDAGIVLLDAISASNQVNEYPVFWTTSYNLARLSRGEPMDSDVNTFSDYPAWVVSRLESIKAPP